jgi:hypothetical protein
VEVEVRVVVTDKALYMEDIALKKCVSLMCGEDIAVFIIRRGDRMAEGELAWILKVFVVRVDKLAKAQKCEETCQQLCDEQLVIV